MTASGRMCARASAKDFAVTVNSSILETIARCINTSLTVILTCLAIYLFGGVTIQQFIMALLIGVVVGIYDSIFVAGPLLVLWDRGLKTSPRQPSEEVRGKYG